MALTKEQFSQLPEFAQADYEQAGDVYQPKAEGKASALKASLDALDGKFKTADTQLRELLSNSEEDRTKAENAALERLKKEGKIDEILADYERRSTETKTQYETRIANLEGVLKTEKRDSLLNDIALELNVFDSSKKIFQKLLRDRIEIDAETGKPTFLDENGSATSLDKAGFIAELLKDSAYDPIRKAATNTGGRANGNNGSSGGSAEDLTKLSPTERINRAREANKK